MPPQLNGFLLIVAMIMVSLQRNETPKTELYTFEFIPTLLSPNGVILSPRLVTNTASKFLKQWLSFHPQLKFE